MQTTPALVQTLFQPKANSHKGQNGVLLVIGGSKTYHGAPITAIKAAAKIVDLVYFYSPERENNELVKSIKLSTADVIVLDKKQAFDWLERFDCILVGNGLEENKENQTLVNHILRKFNGKVVLDAGAIVPADKKLYKNRVLVTPHGVEFKRAFKLNAGKENAVKAAKQHKCVILLKGRKDIITDGVKTFENSTGNAGMTKGGTGDCLAGLAAALACKNGLLKAAAAGAYINGLAGNLLFKKKGFWFSASDLVEELPLAYKMPPNQAGKPASHQERFLI